MVMTMPKLTKLEREILNHRLVQPDNICECLGEETFDPDTLAIVAEHCASGRFDEAEAVSREMTFAVLKDAVDGSTYFGCAKGSVSEQKLTSIYRAGCSLADKIGALIGERVVFPDH